MTVLQELESAEFGDRLRAIEQLTDRNSIDDSELGALAACLGHPRKIVQRRAAEACAILSARGVAVRGILIARLAAAAPRERWGAAFALSLLAAPPVEALPVLLASLGTGDGDIRWAAANIIVRMKGTEGLVDALRRAMASSNAAQRKMAAYCLRDLDARSPAVEHQMFGALDDPDPGVRMAAMSSLVRLSTNRAGVSQRVIDLLSDASPGVRRAAAVVLGVLGDRSDAVRSALHAAAASSDPSLQRAADRSLRLLEESCL